MKKSSLLIILACLVFLIWTMSCQSPSSSGSPASSKPTADKQPSSSNSDNSSQSGSGTDKAMGFLRLILKDAPIEEAKNIFVTISNIRVHETCEDGEDCFHTVWEDTAGREIDLLALANTPLPFPDATIPAGTYNQIRMAIISGSIVFGPPGEPDPSDESFTLDVPSDEIKTNFHFVLEAAQTITITLDIDAKNSIHVIEKGKKASYKLRPVIHVVEATEVPGS